MKIGILAITLASSILVNACSDTQFQFGQDPATTPELHDTLGNVHENQQLDVLAPITENKASNPAISEPAKVATKPKTTINPTVNLTVATEPAITAPPPAQPIAPVLSNWQPNEALLIRGNELIAGLQKELGKKPSSAEMQKRLQSHMGLTAAQAQQLITSLGLN